MKSRRAKSLLALLLSIVMVFGSSVMVSADIVSENSPASGSTAGVGDMEGVVSSNVFKVSIPVTSVSNSDLEFVLDPQGLIAKTGAKRYDWADGTYDKGATLFFISENKTTAVTKYGASSNALSVNNLSSVSVDVALSVNVINRNSGTNEIALSSNKSFANSDPAMYMALKTKIGKNTDLPNLKTVSDAALTAITGATTSENILKLIPEATDKYGYNWTGTKYTFTLSDNYVTGSQDDSALFFWFEGVANKFDGTKANEDQWYALNDAAPSLQLVWDVKPHDDGIDLSKATLAYHKWGNDGTLWIAKTSSAGFDGNTVKVKVTADGKKFCELEADYNAQKWVSTNWAKITTALGTTPDSYTLVVIDGSTTYKTATITR